jgi:hypothetical protein
LCTIIPNISLSSTFNYINSVSINRDGTTVAIGIITADMGSGKVFIYNKTLDNLWITKSFISTSVMESYYGHKVSLSDDGNTIALSSNKWVDGKGLVKVYNLKSGKWEDKGQSANGTVIYQYFGDKLALSGNGNTYVSTARTPLKLYIYNWVNNKWNTTYIEQKSNGVISEVAISYDGSIVAFGQKDAQKGLGYVSVIQYSNNEWINKGSILKGNNPSDKFGISVSMSSDGNRIACRALPSGNAPYVKIFDWNKNKNDWDLENSYIIYTMKGNPTDNTDPELPISLSGDGNILVIGNPSDGNGKGGYSSYKFSSNKWNLLKNTLLGINESDHLGSSLAISKDGNTIISSGTTDNKTSKGYARVDYMCNSNTPPNKFIEKINVCSPYRTVECKKSEENRDLTLQEYKKCLNDSKYIGGKMVYPYTWQCETDKYYKIYGDLLH